MMMTAENSKEQGQTKRVILDGIKTFGEHTSLHGFRFFWGENSSRLRRIIWIIFLLIVYCFLGCALIDSVAKFFKFPVSTVISVTHHPNMTFPAVTICNHNVIRSSYVMDNELLEETLKVINTGDDIGYDWDSYDRHLATRDWNLTKLALEGAHRLEDMLLQCTWKTYENCNVDWFTTTVTDFGVCYTFNSEGNYSVTRAGSSYGLQLRINIEQHKYSFSEFTGAGLRVLVHSHGERPLVKMAGFSVAPGFATDVAIKRSSIWNLQAPYVPFCKDQIPKYSQIYTSDTCRFECEVDEVIRLCGCKHYRYPGDVRPCDPKEHFHCVNTVLRNANILDVEGCVCAEPCHMERFKTRISMAQWPSEYFSNIFAEVFNVTTEYVQKNLLELNIYYEDLNSEEKSDSPAYNMFGFLGNIGGYFGLLCGASVVTIAEIIDCIMVTLSRVKNKKQRVSA
ncbi:acid-sensing ion channel 1C-like [Apostichopus japonicus]|uniref:acid-sensing ion channel 1C-like n=1 Tax=Stichopus japonicus TaxID=307972 RepID=UPI003AB6DE9D